jgi:hypothetical protein
MKTSYSTKRAFHHSIADIAANLSLRIATYSDDSLQRTNYHRRCHTPEISIVERWEQRISKVPGTPVMRILIATDAWHPQVNGVVRTLTSLARSASTLGAQIQFLTPEGFPSLGVPTYPGLRVALPNRREIARRIEATSPDAIHIATEGPIGWAVRGACGQRLKQVATVHFFLASCSVIVAPHCPGSSSTVRLHHFRAPGRAFHNHGYATESKVQQNS